MKVSHSSSASYPANAYIERFSTPQIVELLVPIEKISCGAEHSFAISSVREVYAWGSNSQYKLGIKTEENPIRLPTLIPKLRRKDICDIASGLDHTFAWSENGEVYGWGSGLYGKLGFGTVENLCEPMILECFTEASKLGMKVTHITCGDHHTMAIVNTEEENSKEEIQKLFVWGCSKNWQLGLDNDVNEDIFIPHQIDPDPWDGAIVQAFACNNYSAAITSRGEIFLWGSGEFGRLGFKTETKQQKIPRLLKELSDFKILKIALGVYHAAALTDQGYLFTWGRGINGQLGHGKMQNEDHPTFIVFFESCPVLDVACGENFTVAISAKQELYSWGVGNLGQLGIGEYTIQNIPQKITFMEDKQIISICCGRRHSLALSSKKRVFAWGGNDSGQIGVEKKSKRKLNSTNSKSPSSTSQISNNSISPKTPFETPTNQDQYGGNKATPPSLIGSKYSHQNIEKTATFVGLDGKNNGLNVPKIETLSTNKTVNAISKPSPNGGGSSPNDYLEQEKLVRKLLSENKLLKARVKELELNSDIAKYNKTQDKIFEWTSQYLKGVDQDLMEENSDKEQNEDDEDDYDNSQSDDGKLEKSAVSRNARMDKVHLDFKKKIDAVKDENLGTAFFCFQMFEKYVKLAKNDAGGIPLHKRKDGSK